MTYATGSIPSSVAVADVNGDGKTDLVVANYGDDSVGVLDNNGNGDFTGQHYVLLEPTMTTVAGPPTPSTYGQSVTFTAMVTAGGTPLTSGSVTFSEGTNVLASSVPLGGNGQASFSISTLSATVNPHLITATYNGDNINYATSSAIASQAVNPAQLTVTGITANNKVYDGTTTATIATSSAALVGVIVGDSVTLDTTHATANFATKNVGTVVPVTVAGLALTGSGSQNYTLVQPTTTANITPRTLTVSATAVSKVYDGTTSRHRHAHRQSRRRRRLHGCRHVGHVHRQERGRGQGRHCQRYHDHRNRRGQLSIDQYHGNGHREHHTAFADSQRDRRQQGLRRDHRSPPSPSPTTVSRETSLPMPTPPPHSPTRTWVPAKAVTVAGITITGTDAGNYTLVNTTALTTANITPLTLTVSATAINKVYDGTTAATVTLADNRVAGDALLMPTRRSPSATRTWAPARSVTVSGITITGTDAGNYSAGQHHGDDHREHHTAVADGHRDRRQQGLRRDHHRHRHPHR